MKIFLCAGCQFKGTGSQYKLLEKTIIHIGGSRVVDPYSFFPDPDPDPEYDVGDQYGSGSGSNTDPGL